MRSFIVVALFAVAAAIATAGDNFRFEQSREAGTTDPAVIASKKVSGAHIQKVLSVDSNGNPVPNPTPAEGPIPAGTNIIGKVGVDQTTDGDTNLVRAKPQTVGTGTADVIMKVQTAATGTNWTAFSSQACTALTVINTAGTMISVRIGGGGESVELPDGSGHTFSVAANANEIGLRRTDTSNTQVDVKAVASK